MIETESQRWTCAGPCKREFGPTMPRVIKSGWPWCCDCVYRDEIAADPPLIRRGRVDKKHPQKEGLF